MGTVFFLVENKNEWNTKSKTNDLVDNSTSGKEELLASSQEIANDAARTWHSTDAPSTKPQTIKIFFQKAKFILNNIVQNETAAKITNATRWTRKVSGCDRRI